MKKKRDFSKVYSYSKITLFFKCKKQYHFNYLDPEVAPIKKQFIKPRDYKTLGQAVHGAITLFYHFPEKERTFHNLKECLEKAWFSETEPDKKPPLEKAGGFEDLKHERKTYLQALRQLRNFFNLGELNPNLFYLPTNNIKDSFDDYENLIKPLGENFFNSEQGKESKTGEQSEPVFISGKFDRIDRLEDGAFKIIDFKTGRENQDKFQLDFYKLLAELNFDLKVKALCFYYLDKGRIEEFNVEGLNGKGIKERVLGKIEIIENTKKFEPKPGRLCDHCDFKEICPVFKNPNRLRF